MNYKSKYKAFGLPLVHVVTGELVNGQYQRGIAKGWIAVGDISFGVFFSIGAVAFGGFAMGGLSFGVLSFAGLSIGIFAFGGGAIGIFALGGGAVALHAAYGGFASAIEFAEGGMAIANHANDIIAKEYFRNSIFFSTGKAIAEHSKWFLALLVIPIIQNLINRKRDKDKRKT